ncbi:MAG: hypothetical protein ACLTAI_06060 [Thomasclavelia sp.]
MKMKFYKTIKQCFNETGYLLDTHTAIGYGVLKQISKSSGDDTKTILLINCISL